MTTSSKTNKEWEKDFNSTFAIHHEEYVTFGIDGLKNWINNALTQAKESGRREGAKEAYTMFFEAIKSAKNKFPNRKEFELVVDVRDIEKSLQELQPNRKGRK